MATKNDLRGWIIEELTAMGGAAHHVRVAEAIWRRHEVELRSSGDLFFTWQYDLRWAKQQLQDSGTLTKGKTRGVWTLLRE